MTINAENFYRQNRKWILWSSIIILGLYQLKAGIIPGWQMQSDFPNYFTSSRFLVEGNDFLKLYDNTWFQQQMISHGMNIAGKFTPFPPPSALILVPLTPLDPLSAKRIWLIINLLLLIPLIRMMKRVAGFSMEENLLLILVCGLGLATNFLLGQMYLLLLFVLFAGYDWVQTKKEFFAGIIWGIAAAIKYLPVIFLIPFLIRRNRKVPLGFFSGFVGVHLISLLIMGTNVYSDYLNVLLHHVDGSIEGQSVFAYQFQSWNVVLRKLFVFDVQQNINPLIASSFLFQLFRVLIYGTVIIIAAKTVYDLRKNAEFVPLSLAVIGISVFEILPASATYHFVLLLFLFCLLLKNIAEEKFFTKSMLVVSFASIGILPILLQKITPITSPFIFYRLWLVTIFYFITIIVIRKIISRTSVSAHDA